MYSGLLVDELEVEINSKTSLNILMQLSDGTLKVNCSTKSIVQLKLMLSCNAFRN